MKKQLLALLNAVLIPAAMAGDLVILDTGLNDRKVSLATISDQLCFSINDVIPYDATLDAYNPSADFSACPNGRDFSDVSDSAETVRLVRVLNNPLRNQGIGRQSHYEHGTDVSNAAWEFSADPRVPHRMVQTFGARAVFFRNGSGTRDLEEESRTATTDEGQTIARALSFYANNPSNVSAITISTVLRLPNLTPPEQCGAQRLGFDAVQSLLNQGIPVFVALDNENHPNTTQTWPQCIPGVFRVGGENAGTSRSSATGVGIGAMGIDFFADDRVRLSDESGNSLAAPRVAKAFAVLREDFSTARVDEIIDAMKQSATDQERHTSRGIDETAPVIESSNLNAARVILTTTGPNDDSDDGDFPDSNESDFLAFIGPLFGNDTAQFDFTFDSSSFLSSQTSSLSSQVLVLSEVAEERLELSGLAAVADAQLVERPRDVIVSMTAQGSVSFSVRINGIPTTVTGFSSSEERTVSRVFHRSLFNTGENSISIVRLGTPATVFGLRSVSVSLTPSIPLEIDVLDTKTYGTVGSNEEVRLTGLRAIFEVEDPLTTHELSMEGLFINRPNEITVFINNQEIGVLNQQNSGSSVSDANRFILPSDALNQGVNRVELVLGNYGNRISPEGWRVRNLLVREIDFDLVATNVAVIDDTLSPSREFDVESILSNLGQGPSDSENLIMFLVSDDNIIEKTDTPLATATFDSIESGQSISLENQFQTEFVNQGLYFGFCIQNFSADIDPSNDCSNAVLLDRKFELGPVLHMLLSE